MKHLNSFNLVHRVSIRKVCVAAFIALFGAFATFFAVKTINDQAMAITGDGERVNVSFDGNSWTNYGPWRTPIFTVSAGGTNYIGTCGSPKMNTTSGEFGAQPYSLDNQQEKILIFYIYTQDSSNALIAHAQRTFFGQSPVNRTDDYAALHAIVGYLNMGRDYGDGDMSADELSFLNWATDTLTHVVNGDSSTSDLNDVWIMAKNYRLFGLKQAEIQAQGMQDVLWIENNAQFGNLKIYKCDGANETCTAQGSASLSGVTFTVKYAGNDRIYDQKTNKFYENGTVVATVTTGNDGTATVSNLPLGTYLVEETSTTNPSYVLNPQSKTITLVNNGATTEETFNNQVARGDVHFTKVNSSDNNSPMANVAFRITSKTTGENHIVVSNSNGVVNTATNAHNNHTNGYDSMELSTITYKGYGTWFGSTPVDNSLGALPYDSYDIVELNCDANQYCHDVSSQKKSFTITSNNQNVDLGKWTNDCPVFSLATTATDNADGDKMIANISNAKIKDKIDYCLSAGETFTIKGILMDKATGQALTINGQTIEKTITVTPTSDCGTANMVFDLNASELAGKQIVVFEYAYSGNKVVESHEDINDEDQTVSVIHLETSVADAYDGDKSVLASNEAKVIDTIKYCLDAEEEYVIKGILMDKTTGEPLLIDGKTVEQSINLTTTEPCGEINMTFSFDASHLDGAEVVVFESVYDLDEKLIISHEDIDDEAQTFNIYLPPPDTGLFTVPETGNVTSTSTGSNWLAITFGVVIVVSGAYLGYHFLARRKFFSKIK